MTWCDKMASTPAVGLLFEESIVSDSQILAALAPILNRFTSVDKIDFQIEERNPWSLTAITNDGFRYTIDHTKISVTFQHRVKVKPVSGGPPVMEMLSRPMPYSDLLRRCIENLVEISGYMRAVRIKNILRVGVISTTVAGIDDMPPGVGRFFSHLGAPWEGKISDCQARILANLDEGERATDRCIHGLVVPEANEELTTLNLDWQRKFHKPQPSDERTLQRILGDARVASLAYFEEFGIGARFNEAG